MTKLPLILLLSLACAMSGCGDGDSTWYWSRIRVTNFDGSVDTVVVYHYNDENGKPQVWLNEHGCIQMPTETVRCGVRSFEIVSTGSTVIDRKKFKQ
jgi:hypothetical protein